MGPVPLTFNFLRCLVRLAQARQFQPGCRAEMAELRTSQDGVKVQWLPPWVSAF